MATARRQPFYNARGTHCRRAMTDTATPGQPSSEPPTAATCARCDRALADDDRVVAGDRQFCRSCYETLRLELQRTVEAMSTDVNYPMAVAGAILGGIAGILLWWGFTVLTKFAVGLVAVAIGFLVGHGAVRFSGGKRSAGLQALAIVVAVLAFAVATYLVTMTFVNDALTKQGDLRRVPFPPSSVEMFVRVVWLGFGVMDLVFLAIVVWEAWRIPRPLKLPGSPA